MDEEYTTWDGPGDEATAKACWACALVCWNAIHFTLNVNISKVVVFASIILLLSHILALHRVLSYLLRQSPD